MKRVLPCQQANYDRVISIKGDTVLLSTKGIFKLLDKNITTIVLLKHSLIWIYTHQELHSMCHYILAGRYSYNCHLHYTFHILNILYCNQYCYSRSVNKYTWYCWHQEFHEDIHHHKLVLYIQHHSWYILGDQSGHYKNLYYYSLVHQGSQPLNSHRLKYIK